MRSRTTGPGWRGSRLDAGRSGSAGGTRPGHAGETLAEVLVTTTPARHRRGRRHRCDRLDPDRERRPTGRVRRRDRDAQLRRRGRAGADYATCAGPDGPYRPDAIGFSRRRPTTARTGSTRSSWNGAARPWNGAGSRDVTFTPVRGRATTPGSSGSRSGSSTSPAPARRPRAADRDDLQAGPRPVVSDRRESRLHAPRADHGGDDPRHHRRDDRRRVITAAFSTTTGVQERFDASRAAKQASLYWTPDVASAEALNPGGTSAARAPARRPRPRDLPVDRAPVGHRDRLPRPDGRDARGSPPGGSTTPSPAQVVRRECLAASPAVTTDEVPITSRIAPGARGSQVTVDAARTTGSRSGRAVTTTPPPPWSACACRRHGHPAIAQRGRRRSRPTSSRVTANREVR